MCVCVCVYIYVCVYICVCVCVCVCAVVAGIKHLRETNAYLALGEAPLNGAQQMLPCTELIKSWRQLFRQL